MTDLAPSGSAEQPSAVTTGNPGTQQAGAVVGSSASDGKSWLDGLSEGNRRLAENKGWKAPEDIDKALTSYGELERLQGESLRVPGADAKPEDWDKFYNRLGRPDAPDKYEFKRPEGMPENLPYNQELANAAKPWMHEAGLSPKQAQLVHDKFSEHMAAQQQAHLQAVGKSVEDTHAVLTRDWGPTDSESFKAKHEMANRAIKKLGLVEAYQKSGLILQDGSLTDPQIAKAFSVIGESMFKEDTIGAGSIQEGVNPFRSENSNVTAQSLLVKNDPDKARRLIREAGKNPASFGL